MDVFAGVSRDILRDRAYETVIRYYDTPDFVLDQNGAVLRSMDECPPYFQSEVCVKTKGNLMDGILKREEYELPGEAPKPGQVPDIDVLTHPRAREIVAPARGKKLSEAFNTVTRRHDMCRVIEVEGKKVGIDVAVDDISFIETTTGRILKRAFEAEVEYKKTYSDPGVTPAQVDAALKKVLKALTGQVRMRPISESRGETGFRLLREKKAGTKRVEPKNPPSFNG